MSEHGKHPDESFVATVSSLDAYRARRAREIEEKILGHSFGGPGVVEDPTESYDKVTNQILREAGVTLPKDHIAPVIDIYGLE